MNTTTEVAEMTMSALMPGGYTRSALVVGPTSPHAVSGHGCYVVDEAGRTLIDFNNDFTALVHGNAHPALVKAGRQAVEDGSAFGLPTRHEDTHARLLIERLPGVEQVRYTCSGSEAVMMAVRLARAATGRSGIVAIRGAYHGFTDSVIASGEGRTRRGIPPSLLEELSLVDANDGAQLEAIVVDKGEQLAAILIDALPNRAGLVSISADFLRRARELCDAYEILLIDDEVISLRTAYHGIAAERGVRPDIVVVGKIIGGGHPSGAILATRQLMRLFDPAQPESLEHGGTFAANPVMLRAGAEALRLLDAPAIDRLNSLGRHARERIAAAIGDIGWTVRGEGSLFRPIPPKGADAPTAQRRLYWAAFEREVSITPTGLCALSTPMDVGVVDAAIDRLVDAVRCVNDTLSG